MRIIRYLKESKAAVALIVVLLIVQAFADLSLPRYTSDLVDVGIQQAGIEDAAPEAFRAEMFAAVCLLASPEDEAYIESSYDLADDGTYRLNAQGEKSRASLDGAVAMPFAMAYFAESASESGTQAQGAGFDFGALIDAYDRGEVTKDDVLSLVDAASAQLNRGGVDDALVQQQAIAAAKHEYEQLGYDMGAMQMRCLASIGARMLGVAAVMMLASVAVGYIASRTAAKTAKRLRERLFAKVLAFSDADVQAFSAASLITRGTNDIQQIQMVVTVLLRMVLYAPILAVGGIIMVSHTDASMSWVVVVAVAAIFAIVAVLMALAMPKFKVMQKLIDRVNLVSREMLTGLPVIRAFGRQDYEEKRFDAANADLMHTQLFANRVMTFMMPSMMLVMNAVSVLIVWVGGFSIDAGVIQTGDLIAFITYSMVIIMSFLMLGMVSVMLPRADVAAQRVDEVLVAPVSVSDPVEPKGLAVDADKGAEIAFDDVTFCYDGESDPVLDHVSFTAEAGKTTAVIGSTGSGKSTVVKLIERFYDVTSGAVRIDGVDVRDMAQRDLRFQLGYVPQKAFLFSGTIADTISYGNPGIDEHRMRLAADIAQASSFIDERDEGFAAAVSQGGANVSGGQRQRLSIARALATDARAYLFDDSFSALDYKTDARLRAALAENLKGKTVLIVAQRISTVLAADRIVVLENGTMAGCGTHAELMRDCEAYREIALSQLSEEELEGGDVR